MERTSVGALCNIPLTHWMKIPVRGKENIFEEALRDFPSVSVKEFTGGSGVR